MGKLEDLIKNDAFYYVAPNGDLNLCDDGHILTPGIGGTYIAKAFWVKNSPQTVTRFKDIYDIREKFKAYLEKMLNVANKHSVLEIAEQAGGKELRGELASPTLEQGEE